MLHNRSPWSYGTAQSGWVNRTRKPPTLRGLDIQTKPWRRRQAGHAPRSVGASALGPRTAPKRRILTNQRRSEEHICDRSRVHTAAVESKTLLKSVTALPGIMNIGIASSDRYHGSRYPPTRLPRSTQLHHALEPLAAIGTDAPSQAGETPTSWVSDFHSTAGRCCRFTCDAQSGETHIRAAGTTAPEDTAS